MDKGTPAALLSEAVRRYWITGIECSLLEVQKLAWFLERAIRQTDLDNPLDLRFNADSTARTLIDCVICLIPWTAVTFIARNDSPMPDQRT